ncbi:MAG: hypothetical protein ACR2N8_05555 [Parvibaculales bacterium]
MSDDSPGFRLPLHFDVVNHRLPAEDIITSLASVQTIVRDLEDKFIRFDDDVVRHPIYVTSFDEGGLKAVILIAGILGGTASLITISESETFGGLYEGFTGRSYNPRAASRSFVEMVKGFLETEVKEIDNITPRHFNLDKSIKGKSDLFKMAVRNRDIQAIGFDDGHDFPIKRDRFAYHTSPLRRHPLPLRTEYMSVIIEKAILVNKKYKWQFINKKTRLRFSAYMHDKEFLNDFLYQSKHPLKQTAEDDEIFARFEVEAVLENGEEKIKHWSVVEVFIFNRHVVEGKGAKLSKIPEALKSVEPEETLPLLEHMRDGRDNDDD